jgi:aryl-alcohol dehydrogenase-like predicted oxidoreductase
MRMSGRRAPVPRDRRGPHVFTRENVVAGVEQSLVRMKTDYLDDSGRQKAFYA